MILESIKCDKCGKLKGETNHWYAVEINIGCRGRDVDPFLVIPFSSLEKTSMYLYAAHYCGRECVAKALAAWLEKVENLAPTIDVTA